MPLPATLLKEIARLSRELTPIHARELGLALAAYPSRSGADAVKAAVPSNHFADVAARLLTVWAAHPAVPGVELGGAVAGAAYAHEAARSEPAMELVLSGPSSSAIHARRTDAVLLEVIGGAKQSLLLVTFSLHMYPDLKRALKDAIARDVSITVLAETPTDRDHFDQDPAVALAGMAVTRLRWPRNRRPPGMVSLHAKMVVADEETVFISSANLSLKGAGDNLEAGVLVRGGDWGPRIARHIRQQKVDGIFLEA